MVKKNPQLFKNITVNKFSKLKGVGGILERYGVVGKSNALVILKELVDNNGTTLGYCCADITGKIANVQKAIMPRQVKKIPLANGKLVTREDGTEFISPIEGEYSKLLMKGQQNQEDKTDKVNSNKSKEQAVVNSGSSRVEDKKQADNFENEQIKALYDKLYKDDIFHIVQCLKAFKRYEVQPSVQQIVRAVENQKMAYPTQRSILVKAYINWMKNREPLKDDALSKPANAGATGTSGANGAAQKPVNNSKNSTNIQSNNQANTQSNVQASKPANTVPASNLAKTNNTPAVDDVASGRSKSSTIESKQNTQNDIFDNSGTVQRIPSNLLRYVVHDNGTVYISGVDLQKLSPRDAYTVDIQVPDFITDGNTQKPVVGITSGAFYDKRLRIRNFQAGPNMRDIAQGAFEGQSIVSLDLSRTKISFVQSRMCCDCVKLTTVLLPDTIERIHEQAFEGCTNLDNVELPDICDTIARNAFACCRNLKNIKSKASYIQDKAFSECFQLQEFDFTFVNDVGSYAFKDTGFVELHIPGNVRNLGNKQFSFCRRLKTVVIDEGTIKIGEYCFYKPSPKDYSLNAKYRHYRDVERLQDITSPKQVIEIGTGAFNNVLNVNCYVGSPTESFCKAFQIPYTLLDYVNTENSQSVRRKSHLLDSTGNTQLERLYKTITSQVPGASNPDYKLDTQKLCYGDVHKLRDEQLKEFGFDVQDNKVEPNILFKSYVNYLTKVCPNIELPFYSTIRKFYQACYINQLALYNDGYNAVYKVRIRVKDTLEEAYFIVVLEGRNRQYVADCNIASDAIIGKGRADDQELPITQYLHAGDKLGLKQTISGEPADGSIPGFGYQKVGKILLEKLNDYSYKVRISKDTYYLVVPSKYDTAIKIHDTCKYEEDPRTHKMVMVQRQEEPYVVILNILKYEDFLAEIKSNKKVETSSRIGLLEQAVKLKPSALDRKIEDVKHVGVEKESYLHQVGLNFKYNLENNQTVADKFARQGLTPDCLTEAELEGLFKSYWMVPKDIPWRSKVGQKQLNKLNEYVIGTYKVIEYRSNMIVKFSNPYMNGVKNAFIFDIYKNGKLVKVMASRYSLGYITSKLYEMSHYDLNKLGLYNVPVLMTNPDKIDEVPAELFYDFYPVLNSKNGWDIQKYVQFRQYVQKLYITDFYIQMYKPTGVFYLVQYSYKLQDSSVTEKDDTKKEEMRAKDRKRTVVAHPLFPIGQMDRALIVAATTNINSRNIGILDELMAVSVVTCNMYNIYGNTNYIKPNSKQVKTYNNYIEARKLLINGVDEVDKYRGLVDDRAIYMMGLVHHGKLEAEQPLDYSSNDYLDIDLASLGLLPGQSGAGGKGNRATTGGKAGTVGKVGTRRKRRTQTKGTVDVDVLDIDMSDISDDDLELDLNDEPKNSQSNNSGNKSETVQDELDSLDDIEISDEDLIDIDDTIDDAEESQQNSENGLSGQVNSVNGQVTQTSQVNQTSQTNQTVAKSAGTESNDEDDLDLLELDDEDLENLLDDVDLDSLTDDDSSGESQEASDSIEDSQEQYKSDKQQQEPDVDDIFQEDDFL